MWLFSSTLLFYADTAWIICRWEERKWVMANCRFSDNSHSWKNQSSSQSEDWICLPGCQGDWSLWANHHSWLANRKQGLLQALRQLVNCLFVFMLIWVATFVHFLWAKPLKVRSVPDPRQQHLHRGFGLNFHSIFGVKWAKFSGKCSLINRDADSELIIPPPEWLLLVCSLRSPGHFLWVLCRALKL